MENNQTNEKQQDYELQAVPDSARKGFLPMFMIMMGFTFFFRQHECGRSAWYRPEHDKIYMGFAHR